MTIDWVSSIMGGLQRPHKSITSCGETWYLQNGFVGHPFKYESHRLGSENSEDALSWNVFRSLQEGGQLARVAGMITGEFLSYEPFLYLWGICTTDDELKPWSLLMSTRAGRQRAITSRRRRS